MMTVSELEEAYEQAHDRLLRGELDDEEFKADVDRLRFEDELGRQWKIGWYTGKWYRHDQGQWLQDTPAGRRAARAPLAAPAADRRRSIPPGVRPRSRAVWLAVGIAGLLLVASVLLILGWNRAGESGDLAAGGEGSPSATALLPASGGPTATANSVEAGRRVAAATEPPSPTATARATRPAASPTAARTARPTATAAPSSAAGASPSPTTTPAAPTPAPTAARARPAPTALPALTGQVFFPVYDPNPDRRTMDIYAVRLPAGTRQIVLGQASQPALSRNGQRLAFRSWDSAQRGLVVRELVSGDTWTWVGYGEAARPSWGPDNQAIVFASQQESDRRWRLYHTLGTEVDRVRRHGGDILGRVPDWLADGRIVYWECPEDKCGLYLMRGDGTSPLRLTMAEHDTAPAASPDSTRVAFMSNRDGDWEIYTVSTSRPESPEGQGLVQLTKNGARDGLPTWSPDGQWLAFVTDREGSWAVWAARPDGSSQRKLFDLGGPLEGKIAAVTDGDQHGWTWESLAWGP